MATISGRRGLRMKARKERRDRRSVAKTASSNARMASRSPSPAARMSTMLISARWFGRKTKAARMFHTEATGGSACAGAMAPTNVPPGAPGAIKRRDCFGQGGTENKEPPDAADADSSARVAGIRLPAVGRLVRSRRLGGKFARRRDRRRGRRRKLAARAQNHHARQSLGGQAHRHRQWNPVRPRRQKAEGTDARFHQIAQQGAGAEDCFRFSVRSSRRSLAAGGDRPRSPERWIAGREQERHRPSL